MKNKNRLLFSLLITVALPSGIANAATWTKADNTTALTTSGSWTVAGVPAASGDSLLFDSTLTAYRAASIGAGLNVVGIQQTNAAGFEFEISSNGSNALSIGTGGVTITTGARLTFSSPVVLTGNQTWSLATGRINVKNTLTTGGNTLGVSGSGTGSGILSFSGNNTLGSEVTIGTMDRVYVQNGTVTFNGTNNTNSNFYIFGGTANVASMGNLTGASSIGKGSAFVQSGATLNYTGGNFASNKGFSRDSNGTSTIAVTTSGATLSMSGNLTTNTGATTGGWSLGGAGNLTLSGNIANGTSTAVTKTGAGTVTLSGSSNAYAGQTTVSGGKLTIASTGNINSTSGVSIGAGEFNYNASTALTKAVTFSGTGGTLSGTGTINQAVNVTTGNTLAIGNSVGQMNFVDTLGLNGTTVMEIDGTAGAGVTSGHDFANVTGAITYGGALMLDMGTVFTIGSYSWNVFDFASATGTFSTITLADQYSGSLLDGDSNGVWDLTSGDNTWQFNQSTGALGLTVIPEPKVAGLLGGLGVLCLLRRRTA